MNDSRTERSLFSSPLVRRYASPGMLEVFSEERRIRTWRQLWTDLAEAQHELGLPVTAEQVAAMRRAAVDPIDFEAADEEERRLRHDVMAHIKVFARACPEAGGVIHLGATSCFVVDNTDLIAMRAATTLVRQRLCRTIEALSGFAASHKSQPTLAYTHFQPAQLTTVGKRACLWIQDLVADLEQLEHFLEGLRFRGVKGTTGTQASFLELFGGDREKVKKLDELVTAKCGFPAAFPVTGQTYPRKVDATLLNLLAGIAVSAHKFAVDLRLLAHEKEVEEPFEKEQVGSSAMAYKRNPMRCERITSLARFAMNLAANGLQTAANQWLERTLDDSAAKRIVVPEAFLAVDAILVLYRNVAAGMTVNPGVIQAHLQDEIDAMATENILMVAVQAGGNRQELHETIRRHALAASARQKLTGGSSDLLERLKKDSAFAAVIDQVETWRDPALYVGCSVEQVDEFLGLHVTPLLRRRAELLEGNGGEIRV